MYFDHRWILNSLLFLSFQIVSITKSYPKQIGIIESNREHLIVDEEGKINLLTIGLMNEEIAILTKNLMIMWMKAKRSLNTNTNRLYLRGNFVSIYELWPELKRSKEFQSIISHRFNCVIRRDSRGPFLMFFGHNSSLNYYPFQRELNYFNQTKSNRFEDGLISTITSGRDLAIIEKDSQYKLKIQSKKFLNLCLGSLRSIYPKIYFWPNRCLHSSRFFQKIQLGFETESIWYLLTTTGLVYSLTIIIENDQEKIVVPGKLYDFGWKNLTDFLVDNFEKTIFPSKTYQKFFQIIWLSQTLTIVSLAIIWMILSKLSRT